MKKKLLLLSSATLIIILSVFVARNVFVSLKPASVSPTPATQQKNTESKIQIIIDYGNDEKVNSDYLLSDNDTAFSVLEKITLDKQIPLETESYDFGIFVKSINDLESGADMAWIYFVNSESGQVAADQHILSSGDMVEWKYIEPEF